MAVVGRSFGRATGSVTRRLDRLGDRTFALLISIPALLMVAIFVLPPILAVFGLSLFRIELARRTTTRPFVGLFNFVTRLPLDDIVLEAIPRTLGFAAAVTIVTIPLALLTALILNRTVPRLRAVPDGRDARPGPSRPWSAGVIWRFIFDTHSGHHQRHPHRTGAHP